MQRLDWTHQEVTITDIRKVSNLYILSINNKSVTPPLFVNEKIFNERLKLYFLKESSLVTRQEILGVKWNMYITQGSYIKVNTETNDIKKFDMDANKFYVSYLEIAGPLASFSNIYNNTK